MPPFVRACARFLPSGWAVAMIPGDERLWKAWCEGGSQGFLLIAPQLEPPMVGLAEATPAKHQIAGGPPVRWVGEVITLDQGADDPRLEAVVQALVNYQKPSGDSEPLWVRACLEHVPSTWWVSQHSPTRWRAHGVGGARHRVVEMIVAPIPSVYLQSSSPLVWEDRYVSYDFPVLGQDMQLPAVLARFCGVEEEHAPSTPE